MAVIKVLLAAGAALEASDKDGMTPLMEAARWNKNPAVVMAFLEAGADAKAKSNEGQTALDLIKENKFLKDNQAIQDALRAAMQK